MTDEQVKSMNRRKFISAVGILGAAASLIPVPGFAKSGASQTENGLIKCSPYLQAAFGNHTSVRWVTNTKCFGWVEYGESPDKLNLKAHRVIDGMRQANNTIHDIPLSNLIPGKKYYYKAVSKPIEKFTAGKVSYGEAVSSNVYSFIQPSAKSAAVHFSVFNDIHDRPETFAHMWKFKGLSSLDFVVLNGDIFSSLKDGEDQIVDHLLKPVSELWATHTPFIYSRGNHEARGEYARQLPDYVNGREHKFYYSFESGPVYFIIMDTGEDKEDNHPVYGDLLDFDSYRLEQKAWLEKEVQKDAFKRAKYRVVIAHIPPFYTPNKDAHGTSFFNDHWVPIMNRVKISLLISGHTHVRKMHDPVKGKHDFPIVVGGGPLDGQRTIINVAATNENLKLEMIDDSGKSVGSLKIDPVS
ncbi:MAG: metallophosphoesterase [Sphingobacteriaceae bacterium]|jgi:predicted phosphodiesterase|nr:metallophosphoesterase [Sphingobacteriaceae bacterium]